jgi:transcriptional regulator with XRE-family HTH domain
MSRERVRDIAVDFDPVGVGRRIRHARKVREWRQGDLARATGLSTGLISCYELGLRTPRLVNMLRIAAAVRRSLDYLVTGRGERN